MRHPITIGLSGARTPLRLEAQQGRVGLRVPLRHSTAAATHGIRLLLEGWLHVTHAVLVVVLAVVHEVVEFPVLVSSLGAPVRSCVSATIHLLWQKVVATIAHLGAGVVAINTTNILPTIIHILVAVRMAPWLAKLAVLAVHKFLG